MVRFKRAICFLLTVLISFAVLAELAPLSSEADTLSAGTAVTAGITDGAKKSSKKKKKSKKTKSFIPPEGAELKYKAFVHGKGWDKNYTAQGKTMGRPGKNLGIEAFQIELNSAAEGKIFYNAYIKGTGWTGQTAGSEICGNTTAGRSIQKIKIYLSGELLLKYRVYYRVCLDTDGWLGWECDGFAAGNDDYNRSIEAMQIVLVDRSKGGKSPGNINNVTSKLSYGFKDASKIRANMIKKAQKYSSKTKYLVLIDSQYCFLGVFKGKKHHWELIKFYICSPGVFKKYWNGTYDLGIKTKGFYSYKSQVYWGTRIHRELWIHSITYKGHNGKKVLDGRLGKRISHGCIRLATADAKWVYDHVPSYSKCVLYKKKIKNVFRPY